MIFQKPFGKTIFVCLALLICVCLACKKSNPAPVSQAAVTFIHALPSVLNESSGLCYTDGNLWSFGDSGNPPYLFKIDTASGAILQTVKVQNFSNEDWEDIAADDNYIYIGDFGNNTGERKNLRVLRIKKSDINTSTEVNVNAEAIYFSFADQSNFTPNPHSDFNCEALTCVGGNLYLFSKDESDFRTRCYQLSKVPGSYSITPISSFDSEGEITSASYNASTNQLALGGYENKKVHAFIWLFTNFEGNDFFEGKKTKILLRADDKPWQTEGLTYLSANRMFLSCESNETIPASLYSVSFR